MVAAIKILIFRWKEIYRIAYAYTNFYGRARVSSWIVRYGLI